MGVRSFGVVWLAFVCALAAAVSARSDDELVHRRLVELLEKCWDSGDTAKSLADAKFAALERTPGVDAQTFYGHALVMMYQRRYDDAAKSLGHAVKADDHHLSAWRARIWLALLTKSYGTALAGMEQLAEATGKLGDKAENKDSADEAARFLGSAYGFVDGPLSEVAAVASRKSTEKAILAALSEEQRATFTEARQGVIEKFTGLTTDKQDSREAAVAEEEAEKQKILADVAKRREEIAKQTDELKERRAKVESELKDELDEVAKLDRPLVAQLASLQSQLALAQRNADTVLLDIQALEGQLAAEKDPKRRDQLRRDIDRLRIVLGRYDAEVVVFNSGIAGVQAQRAPLVTRQSNAQRNFGGQIQSIDRQFAGFKAEEKKFAGLERKANKPSSGSTGKVNALGMTATALKTYEPFPIDQERQRLLESLK